MVEIREESTTRLGEDDQPSTSSSTGDNSYNNNASTNRPSGNATLSDFVRGRTLDCTLFATRCMTIFFAVLFLFPSNNSESYYYKALAAGAATNALRLHQRIGGVSFTREFIATLLIEDSCHYLFYCILFLTCAPVTMALLPVSLYAALHASNFAVTVLQGTGRANSPMTMQLSNLCATQTPNCLGIIACSEIFLVPLLVSLIIVGKATFFMPFVYYRFLTLRYSSRRNPYTRQAFFQMRCSLEQISNSASCPGIVSSFINRAVYFISGLAPQV